MNDESSTRSTHDEVSIEIPAQPNYLSFARLIVGALATDIDLTIDEIEDLYLAVDELCLTLLRNVLDDSSRLRIVVKWSPDQVHVRCQVALRPDGSEATPDLTLLESPTAISELILDALVDEHGVTTGVHEITAWLRKYRRPLSPSG